MSSAIDNNLSAWDLFMVIIFHTIQYDAGAETSGYKEFIKCTGNILHKCLEKMKSLKENACRAWNFFWKKSSFIRKQEFWSM